MLRVLILPEFLQRKYLCLRIRFEPGEEECERAEFKEIVLRVATVPRLHRVSYDGERNQRVLKILVILVVSM